MKFVRFAIVAAAMTVSAYADTAFETCITWTNDNPPVATGVQSFTCNPFSSLSTGGTVTGAFLIYESDYSSGTNISQIDTTVYTFAGTGVTLAFASDTVTTTGASSSTSQTSLNSLAFNGVNPPILAGFYDNVTAGIGNLINGTYDNQMTTGNALADTGYVQEAFTFTPATTGDAPEPATLALMGAGLLGVGLVNRRRRSQS